MKSKVSLRKSELFDRTRYPGPCAGSLPVLETLWTVDFGPYPAGRPVCLHPVMQTYSIALAVRLFSDLGLMMPQDWERLKMTMSSCLSVHETSQQGCERAMDDLWILLPAYHGSDKVRCERAMDDLWIVKI